MTRDEFVKKYTEIVQRSLQYGGKARREGLLPLLDQLDQERTDDERDIFQIGLRLVVNGINGEIIEKKLSDIIEQEKDEYLIILKNIQKVAVHLIHWGLDHYLVYSVLNSYSCITFLLPTCH
jgi:flagellar motor component MotA